MSTQTWLEKLSSSKTTLHEKIIHVLRLYVKAGFFDGCKKETDVVCLQRNSGNISKRLSGDQLNEKNACCSKRGISSMFLCRSTCLS